MRALFIHSIDGPRVPRMAHLEIPLGVSYLAAVLAHHSHQAGVLCLSKLFGGARARVDQTVSAFHPDVLCFSSIHSEFAFQAEIASYVRARYPKLLLVAGGPHVTLNPEAAIREAFDAICISEGEHPLLELLDQHERGMPLHGIQNLWIKRGAHLEQNETRPFLEPLDQLPFPDRALWKPYLFEDHPRCLAVLVSRGCPFSCGYCCNHALRRASSGSYLRFRSPENILAEIQHLLRTHSTIREIYLETETAAANPRWFLDLCAGLSQLNETLPRPVAYGANFRFSHQVDYDRLFSACQRANFRFVGFGLETGNEQLRRQLLRRDYSNQLVLDTVAAARRYGLGVRFYNLIGLPEETPATIDETIELNRRCRPDTNGLSIFFPYQGSDLYQTCKDQGLLPESIDMHTERSRAVLNLPGISRRALRRAYIWFDYSAFKGSQPRAALLLIALHRWIRTSDPLYHLWCQLTTLPIGARLRLLLQRAIFK